jgi:hypothetical protein
MNRAFVKNTAVACLFAAGLTLGASAQTVAPSPTWTVPTCAIVISNGAPGMTYTPDEGATYTPTNRALTGTSYTGGLVALGAPNTLVSAVESTLYRSTDAGCTWRKVKDLGAASGYELLTLSAAGASRAYVWADNRGVLFRLDGTTVTSLKSPVGTILGLTADPTNGDRLRLGDDRGQIWESVDAGASWQPVGAPALADGWAYRVALDPGNLDHVVVGAVTTGSWVTFDAGRTWTQSTGLTPSGGPVNVFNVVISPSDPNVVWSMGLDIAESDAGAPSQGRHLFRSVDGGLTFGRAFDQNAEATLVNGPTMAVHPTDPDVLYFVFGTWFGNYGTDLYRLDATTGQLTWTHNATYHGLHALAFSPVDPSVMYLGLVHVQAGGF